MTLPEAIESIQSQIRAKDTWLDTFAWGKNKRPAHEIAVKETELEALKVALSILQSTQHQ